MFLKKYIATVTALVIFAFGCPSLKAQTLGDVNADNTLDIVDALMIAQYSENLPPAPFDRALADVNCDGSIDIRDAQVVAHHYVGLTTELSCGSTHLPTEDPQPPTGTGSVSCVDYPVWNSNIVYSEGGIFVQYNCNLYRSNYFTFGDNPEEVYVDHFSTWVLQGACNDDCRMGEGPWTACGEWDNWKNGDYTIYNNVWGGDAAGSQCIWAESYSTWGVTADHPNTGGVKSYPNTVKMIEMDLNSIKRLTSSFDVSVPRSGSYATTYDIWADNHAFEIMSG